LLQPTGVLELTRRVLKAQIEQLLTRLLETLLQLVIAQLD
jgi:hypothetical protein